MSPQYSKFKHLYLNLLWIFTGKRLKDQDNKEKISCKLFHVNHWITITVISIILSIVLIKVWNYFWYVLDRLWTLSISFALDCILSNQIKKIYIKYEKDIIINVIWLIFNIPLLFYVCSHQKWQESE